jgi:hypothetical protein
MNPADQVIDLRAVSRGERRHSHPLSHDVLDGLWSASHSASSSSSALRFACLRR